MQVKARADRIRTLKNWLGFLPFLLVCMAFEFIPILFLLRGSFIQKSSGTFTLANYQAMRRTIYVNSFLNSIKISALSALIGVVLGSLIGYAVYRWPSARVKDALISLSDVTTNFAGAPLAFSFIIILGMNGVITQFLLKSLNYSLYPNFSIYSFSGLLMAYVYFQLPLMVLGIIPAFAGIRREWQESATNLGATTLQFWRRIGLPILSPSLIAGFTLLFANAFGAYATAYTLVESQLSLVTLQIGYMIAGEVRQDPGVGMAMAVLSLMIMGVSIWIYRFTTNRARAWSKSE